MFGKQSYTRWLQAAGNMPLVVTVLLLTLHVNVLVAGETGKIMGKAVNAKTKEALPSVNVMIVGTSYGASTDLDGDYFVANLPPGTYSLRASIVGFKPVLVNGIRVYPDKTTEVNIPMEETVVEFGGVIEVTAVRPLVEKDNTSSRVIVESAEIVSHPTANVSQVLASFPGVSIENGEMLIRGRNLNEVAVLVDGARSRNPMDQTSYMNNVSLRAVESIDLMTGSFNAEYGEAQTAVIKITTKEGGNKYHLFGEARYTPPGLQHWGRSIYDYSSPLYWENSHTRHLQWWIEYPDHWADPNGILGSDPRSLWTAEQAYQNFMDTHKPLTDYENTPSYQFDAGFSGPVPMVDDMTFFVSGTYQSIAPYLGNSFRKRGIIFDGAAKIAYKLGEGKKLIVSGSYNNTEICSGMFGPSSIYGIEARYAYMDYFGLPERQNNAQTIRFTNVVDASTMYEIQLARTQTLVGTDILPGDPIGWVANGPVWDNVLAIDSLGSHRSMIGYHTLGYYYRNNDNNVDWKLTATFMNHPSKNWEFKAGVDGILYRMNHFNQAKAPDRIEQGILKPYQGDAYLHNKLEFGGLIVNAGLRFDFYNSNDIVYSDLFDPLNGPSSLTKLYTQLSPRLGIAHPIDDKTVIHFSYGHFFQGPPYGDYGEMNDPNQRGTLTRFIELETGNPSSLGNRQLEPQKTVEYEIGVERSFAEEYLVSATAYYKDYTNTIRGLSVQTSNLWGYKTNGNGDYADERGLEISLRKRPLGFFWGHINYTSRLEIIGRSGDPVWVSPTQAKYKASGDDIRHHNPLLNAWIAVQSPKETGILWGLLDDILLSVEHQTIFPNSSTTWNYFSYAGSTYIHPVEHNTNMRATKIISLFDRLLELTAYIEVRNVFNVKHVNFDLFSTASLADQKEFVESGFKIVPGRDAFGKPFLEMQKYTNLPRSMIFGVSFELGR